MNLENIHNDYVIGIGGIGMSAIANYFKSNGENVAGYDKVSTEITKSLQNIGIEIHFEDSVNFIPPAFKNNQNTLVVLLHIQKLILL